MYEDIWFVPGRLARAVAGYRYIGRHAKGRVAFKSFNLNGVSEAEIEGKAGSIVYMGKCNRRTYSSGSSSSVMSAGLLIGMAPLPRAPRLSDGCSMSGAVGVFCLVSTVFEGALLRLPPLRVYASGIDEKDPELFCRGESWAAARVLAVFVEHCPSPPANMLDSSSSLVQSSSGTPSGFLLLSAKTSRIGGSGRGRPNMNCVESGDLVRFATN